MYNHFRTLSRWRAAAWLYLQLAIPRKRGVTIRLALLTLTVFSLVCGWRLAELTSDALLPPRPVQSLDHFRVNRDLKYYLDNINVLVEPSNTVCSLGKRFPILVMVTSAPMRFERRQAIRDTWAKHLPTYFIMGLDGPSVDYLLVDNYLEAKNFSDTIIFEFQDHYQNLTLKTALMIQWMVTRCFSATMLFKTDDDVLVNPWILRRVVEENLEKDLVGYRKLNSYLHRDEYNKWYLPRWLHWQDSIPEYLSGTGYLINARNLQNISQAAIEVPLINLEDVYFTYIVSRLKLGLTLTHDSRLSPYRPWLPLKCMYWGLASAHSFTAKEILDKWTDLEALGPHVDSSGDRCSYFLSKIWSEWFLY